MILQAKINLTEKKTLSYQLFCFHLNHKKLFIHIQQHLGFV